MTTDRYTPSDLRSQLPEKAVEAIRQRILAREARYTTHLDAVGREALLDMVLYQSFGMTSAAEQLSQWAREHVSSAGARDNLASRAQDIRASREVGLPGGGRGIERFDALDLTLDAAQVRDLYRAAMDKEFEATWLLDTKRPYEPGNPDHQQIRALQKLLTTATLYGDASVQQRAQAALKDLGADYLTTDLYGRLPSGWRETWDATRRGLQAAPSAWDKQVRGDVVGAMLDQFKQVFYAREDEIFDVTRPEHTLLWETFQQGYDAFVRAKTDPAAADEFVAYMGAYSQHPWLAGAVATAVGATPELTRKVMNGDYAGYEMYKGGIQGKDDPDDTGLLQMAKQVLKARFGMSDAQVASLTNSLDELIYGDIDEGTAYLLEAQMAVNYAQTLAGTGLGVLVSKNLAYAQFLSWSGRNEALFGSDPEAFGKLVDGFDDFYATYLREMSAVGMDQQQLFDEFLESEYGQVLVSGRLDREGEAAKKRIQQAEIAKSELARKFQAAGLSDAEAVAYANSLSQTDARSADEYLARIGDVAPGVAAVIRGEFDLREGLQGIQDAQDRAATIEAQAQGRFDREIARAALDDAEWLFYRRGLSSEQAQYAAAALRLRPGESVAQYQDRVQGLSDWAARLGSAKSGADARGDILYEELLSGHHLDADYYVVSSLAQRDPQLYGVDARGFAERTLRPRENALSQWTSTAPETFATITQGGALDPKAEASLFEAARRYARALPVSEQAGALASIMENSLAILNEYDKMGQDAQASTDKVDPAEILNYIARQTLQAQYGMKAEEFDYLVENLPRTGSMGLPPGVPDSTAPTGPAPRDASGATITNEDDANPSFDPKQQEASRILNQYGLTPEQFLKAQTESASAFIAKGGGSVLNQARGTPSFSDFLGRFDFGGFVQKVRPKKAPAQQLMPQAGRSYFI